MLNNNPAEEPKYPKNLHYLIIISEELKLNEIVMEINVVIENSIIEKSLVPHFTKTVVNQNNF